MKILRQKIYDELSKRGIKCSPQAINALVYSASLSSPEIVGCSDSLLMGLLRCGSYTIEALISSGVDENYIKEAALNSVKYSGEGNSDPIEMLFAPHGIFGAYLNNLETKSKTIETSDLLEIAITPESLDGEFADWFPKHLAKSSNASSNFEKHLENQVCQVIDICADIISKNVNVERTICYRSKALTSIEKKNIKEELYDLYPEAVNWAIELTNSWFTEKKINLNNPEMTINIIDNVFQNIRYGTSLFLESGGDFRLLNSSLLVAKKLAPERDQPTLALVEREGKIYVKQFSYNSTIFVDDEKSNIVSVGTELPLPLTTISVLSQFEDLINSSRVDENSIQKFLECYPEILESLGYVTCHPHVILKQPGENDLIPDFILQRPGNNGFDILDLKLPSAKITVSKPYLRISHEIIKALAQLRAYRNYFKSVTNRGEFYKMHGLEPLSPELIVVIGRKSQNLNFAERIEINKQVNGLKLLTYDELIEYGKSRAINYKKLADQTF